ncbi:Fucosyl transferase [Trichostrongylus colubriformis]|uniref:Fucosyltransferase n=1 Tax=Trichostrongylus colubriformis TaxID=6319 RepID=A0AAN8IH21_TRICO
MMQTSLTTTSNEQSEVFEFAPSGGPSFFVEELLTNSNLSLRERLNCHVDRTAPPQLILSWNAGHTQENLDGCADWNCKLTHDRKQMGAAGAVRAAWFVSHCATNSLRESYVRELKKSFPVDIYGSCGQLKCARGGACENMLDKDYHFYIAFENSICEDYITEKLWNQGYQRDVVPLVLKRSIVEPFVPPNSFIAVDDFHSTEEMASYLHYLMKNKTAYAEYFSWRREYKVVFLNGKYHDATERPWGFCQVCRLLWEKPRPSFTIKDFTTWWDRSCEADGALVNRLLRHSPVQSNTNVSSTM